MLSVSVVIPSYNRLNVLQRCLDSVLEQTLSPAEIIVVDDGSTDETSEWIKAAYPNVILHTQKNRGVSAARNQGIRIASTEWIAFIDSDDIWMPEKLEKQCQALGENEGHRVCHTEEVWKFRGEPRPVADPYVKQGGWIFDQCLSVCAISPSTSLIHASVFDEVGLFDESLPACEDYDLWLRICSRMEVLLVPEPLIEKHGGHDDQLSNQRGLDRWRIEALRKLLGEGHLNEEQTGKTQAKLLEKAEIYLNGLEKHGRHREAESFRRSFVE